MEEVPNLWKMEVPEKQWSGPEAMTKISPGEGKAESRINRASQILGAWVKMNSTNGKSRSWQNAWNYKEKVSLLQGSRLSWTIRSPPGPELSQIEFNSKAPVTAPLLLLLWPLSVLSTAGLCSPLAVEPQSIRTHVLGTGSPPHCEMRRSWLTGGWVRGRGWGPRTAVPSLKLEVAENSNLCVWFFQGCPGCIASDQRKTVQGGWNVCSCEKNHCCHYV